MKLEEKKEYLDNVLSQNDNEPFFTLKIIGKKPSKWHNYPDEMDDGLIEQCNQIQVIKSWVVWDIDPPKTIKRDKRITSSLEQCQTIAQRLYNDSKSFRSYDSGNVGNHIHAVFPELIRYSPLDRKWLKKEIMLKYGYGTDYEVEKCNPKTPIQMPLTPHRYTLRNKSLLDFNDVGENKIPTEIINKYNLWKIGNSLKKEIKALTPDVEKSIGDIFGLKRCVKYFMDNTFTDGRKRIMFFLISNLKGRHDYDSLRLRRTIKDWVFMNGNFLTDRDVDVSVNHALTNDMVAGCLYCKDLLVSVGKKELCEGCNYN